MFTFSLIKYWKVLILAVLLPTGFFIVTSRYESSGYNRALKEFQEESVKAILRATQTAITDAEGVMQKRLKQQRELFDSELSRAKTESNTTKEIEYVEKQIEGIVYVTGQCEFDTSDIKLLNEAINSGSNHTRD